MTVHDQPTQQLGVVDQAICDQMDHCAIGRVDALDVPVHGEQRRAEQLPAWLHRYNWHRPHASLKAKTPMSRLGLAEDNVLRLHS